MKVLSSFPFLVFANQLDLLESAVFFKKFLNAKDKKLKKLHKRWTKISDAGLTVLEIVKPC